MLVSKIERLATGLPGTKTGMKNTQTTQAKWLTLLAVTAIGLYLCWLMLKPFMAVLAWASVLAIFSIQSTITTHPDSLGDRVFALLCRQWW